MMAHPAGVIALDQGRAERTTPAAPKEWETTLHNIVRLARMGAAISYSAVRQELQQVESDPITVDSQETRVCGAHEHRNVLHQMLRHLLLQADQSQTTTDTMYVAEEYLDLLQDILLKRGKLPLKRRQEAEAAPAGTSSSGAPPPSTQGEHVVKFMRRQTEADALRVAAGVLFTVAGIIGEHTTLVNDSQLVKAGELNSMSRHLPGRALHRRGGDPRPVRPIEPSEMVQWEQHQEEEEKQSKRQALYDSWQSTTNTSWGETGPESPKTQTTIAS